MDFNNARFHLNRGLRLAALISLVAGTACSGDDSGDGAAGSDGTAGPASTGGDDMDDGGTMPAPTTMTPMTTMDDAMDDTMDDTMGDTGTDGPVDTGTADDATGTAGGAELSCDSYCGIYMEACTDFSDYANMEECMDHCGQWPEGAIEDTAGDTLGCRLYHVSVANSGAPDVHCPHASPNGSEVCVAEEAPNCVDYCDTYFDNCTEDNNLYVDMDDCMAQCAPWYPGTVDDTAGNTVGCRTYHAGAPALGDPGLHCPHAGPGGADVCVYQ